MKNEFKRQLEISIVPNSYNNACVQKILKIWNWQIADTFFQSSYTFKMCTLIKIENNSP